MKTLVIGSGPAGLIAASTAANKNNQVIVLEKNEKAGKKLFITGKGRCNVTNNCNEREFIANVVNNSKFLFSAINKFSSKDTIDWFESKGCPLVIERGNRVFPESYKAYDITDALVSECRLKGVSFHFNEEVLSIDKTGDQFKVYTKKTTYFVDNVVIATGGISYPATGSTGDGYRFASNFSHTIVEPVPALTAIKIEEAIPKRMVGFTLKCVSLNVKDGKWKHNEFGELTFYEDYIDGPIAISTSSLINRRDVNNIEMEIDLKPALDEQTLLARINRDIEKRPNDFVGNLLEGLMPRTFMDFFLDNTFFDVDEKCTSFSKAKRIELVQALKHFKLTYLGLNGFERAVVTSGGISTKEINSSTMESKLVENLFFAGEVIDVDAYTGGFNIQTALSTGYLAGSIINERTSH
ncbi:MAG: NAD(P)/FAD-dependent oxidoreductase [Bacilli bacterium]|nr:NAD(P)/FAD-dependent oxidoreductase [Bacilli bacterium]